MSWFDHLSLYFSSAVRSRGNQYYFAGKVKIAAVSEYSVEAEVYGSDIYELEARLQQNILQVACTCPYAQHTYCKHIYALLQSVNRMGYLPALKSLPTVELELLDFYGMDEEDPLKIIVTPDHLPQADKPQPPALAWKQYLYQMNQQYASPQRMPLVLSRPEQEIIYVINLPSILSSGEFTLDIKCRERKKNGEWGKLKPFRMSGGNIESLTGIDQQIGSILRGAKNEYNYYSFHYNNYGENTFKIPVMLAKTLLPLLSDSGRLFLETQSGGDIKGPLEWHAEEIWDFCLAAQIDAGGNHYQITGRLRCGGEQIPLREPQVLMQQGLMIRDDYVCLLDHHGAFPWISLLRQKNDMSIPASQISDFLESLYKMPAIPSLIFPEEICIHEVSLIPRPHLIVRQTKRNSAFSAYGSKLQAELKFDYDAEIISALPLGRGFYQTREKRYVTRDHQEEQKAVMDLQQFNFHRQADTGNNTALLYEITPKNFTHSVSHLVAMGWHVEAEGKLYRNAGSFSLSVTSGIDWFELSGKVDYDGVAASLPALLAALKRKENIIQLDDGTFGLLPEEWLKKYGIFAGMGEVEGEHLKFKKCQAGVLDALLMSQPETTCDELFQQTRRQLQSFDGVLPQDAPPEFQGVLRGYQKEGLGWFDFLNKFGFGGCLADDMGLGKTVQVLAMLEKRRLRQQDNLIAGPSLVVTPKSVIFNWKQEAAKFTPRLQILDHTGAERIAKQEHFENYDLILTTYGTLRQDAVDFQNIEFDYVILDEAQAIKNAGTISAKAARLLRARHRLALSGTPIENHIGELWSLFEFLNPGLLGHAGVFSMTGADTLNPSEETRALLSSALRPFILRRTKAVVAPELPEKTEQTMYCEMDRTQSKLYNELRDHYRLALLKHLDKEGMQKSKIQILEALLRLRQAACHPGLIDQKWANKISAKMEFLLPQLEEIIDEGHKVLVFSQFTSFLSIVRKELETRGITYLYLDGKTKDRERMVNAFQKENDNKIFLISLKAGGLGLNLTAAEYVFLLDPWWNPAVEAQAIDRTHRIGQTQQIFAYRLITRNTVEERVLELQKNKRDLVNAIIREDSGLIRNLRREDLELLLS
ncbi:MAG: SNF2-related protein [Smithella sp.]